jgi:hypothetical protein
VTAAIHEVSFNGTFLQRGFWLYVWEIAAPGGKTLCYVGRTGDSSSTNAQSPFNRMGQHLGFNKNSNRLRRLLEDKGIAPEKCGFRLVAYGPILEEAATRDEHFARRDTIGGLEKALIRALSDSGCELLNTVSRHEAPHSRRWNRVRAAFAEYFPKLNQPPARRKS